MKSRGVVVLGVALLTGLLEPSWHPSALSQPRRGFIPESGTCERIISVTDNAVCVDPQWCMTDFTSCRAFSPGQNVDCVGKEGGPCDPTPCAAFVYINTRYAGTSCGPEVPPYPLQSSQCIMCWIYCCDAQAYNTIVRDQGTGILQCQNERCIFGISFANMCESLGPAPPIP
jgi:hypothetical protein